MARTVNEIYQTITESIQNDQTLGALLTSASQTAIWRLIAYAVAVSIFTLEKLYDIFRQDVDQRLLLMKPHSERWYAEKSKLFQFGDNLPDDSDEYDNSGKTDAEIEQSRIIAYSAVTTQQRGIRIKIAKIVGDDLDALSPVELTSFNNYMMKVKDAGVKLLITSGVADQLFLQLRIIYNPLVLNDQGARIDGHDMEPIKNAIKSHLKNLPFNGVFSVSKLADIIGSVDGVTDFNIDSVQTRYGILPFTVVDISMIPDSGYLRISDENLQINYIPE